MTGSALRSVPSDRSTGACGAWSDIVPRPHGDLALTVGDVAGHGLEARRLRDLLHRAQHGLTVAGLSPEQILTGLRDLINGTDGALATAACVALAPDGSVELANAGHPPPLLIGSDGEIAFVLADVTPPLGAPCELVTSASRQARLGTGDTLVLYTAGVVAGHHKTVDEGIAALAAVAMVSARASVDVLCRRIAEIGELDDDLAVLAVRWDGRSIDG